MNAEPLQTRAGYALVCHEYGSPPDMRCETRGAAGQPGPGEVLIDIHCAAFNFTDHLLVQGRYQDKPPLPCVPGLDAAGIVRSVGAGVTAFQPGDKIVSSGVAGGWASQLVAPANRLVAVPANVELADAVGSINSHLTAYHGLVDRARLAPGERVLILGASGAVGKASVQIAQHLKADVFTAERRQDGSFDIVHLDSGARTHAGQADLKDGLRAALGKRGADVVVDPVGDRYTEAAVRNLAWRGRLLVIGFAAGEIPRIPTNLLLLKGAAIVGVYCGGLLIHETETFTRQLSAMFDIMSLGALSPLPGEIIPAENFGQAWERFSTAPRGTKILLGFA
jgi:NADPH2:quinone reductase